MNTVNNTKRWLKEIREDKVFLKTLFAIAFPIVIQNLISSSLNMIDTFMIGMVGQEEIAAVGLANQLFMLIIIGLTGICAGSSIFISQYWGKKDIASIRSMLGFALITGCIYALLVTGLVQIFPEEAIGFFNKEPRILELGKSYLTIVSISYIFTAITYAYSNALRSIGQTKLPMVVSAIAVLINIIGNTLLIFGLGGFPAMGVAGAALATVLARAFETIILVLAVYIQKGVLAAKLKELIHIPKVLIKRVIKPTVAIVANEMCWGFGTIIYTMAYGHIGSDALAAVQIMNTVNNFFLVAIFALAAAALTMIGNKIGEGKEKLAREYAKRIMFLAVLIGIILSISVALSAPFLVSCFKVTEAVAQSTKILLWLSAVALIAKIFAITMIMGIFRGGGDTKYPLILEAITMWGIGVPIALLGVFVFNLRLEYVVALILIEDFTKAILCFLRFKSGKWVNNIIH